MDGFLLCAPVLRLFVDLSDKVFEAFLFKHQ